MRYFAYLILLLALAVPAAGIDFPIGVGYKWEYKTHSPEGSSITVKTVTAVEYEDGHPVYTMLITGKYGTKIERIKVAEGWVFSNMGGGDEFHPLLPLDPYPGDNWTFNLIAIGKKEKCTYRVEGSEAVTISLGTFDALKIKVTVEAGGESEELYAYYADGIGLIQYSGEDFREELTGYNFEE